jgi:Disulphide bond corrector protein DsbC
MKYLIRDFGTLFTLSICFAAHAQRPSEVVKWSAGLTGTKPNAPSAKLSATIMDGWHVYALSQPDGGPTPLKISIPSGSPLMLAGPIAETKVVRHFDPSFNMETLYYLKTANFNLALKGGDAAPGETLSIDVRFQACNDRLCLPPYTAHVSATLARR